MKRVRTDHASGLMVIAQLFGCVRLAGAAGKNECFPGFCCLTVVAKFDFDWLGIIS